ncbi:hypothetical protein M422DRAFT_153338 [Sphaerobolus stellatus SS14]|nr:hypothetical protein M422DRAFT_153338 [Sphaerobolus stellatus SS14]
MPPVNLTDPVFRGVHRGKRKHDDDFHEMVRRSNAAGVKNMIITGISLHESTKALEIAKKEKMYLTVGCHPTHSTEFAKYSGGPAGYLNALDKLISQNLEGEGRVVAIGECGLDYDRTHFAAPEVQREHFQTQLSLAKKYHLPLFLHSRAAHEDFIQILREEGFGTDGGKSVGANGGVVHSFTGTLDELKELLEMGFHIGINGCSLKTQENLDAAKAIPLDRLMLETDAPWCSLNRTHASNKLLEDLPEHLRKLFFPVAKSPERFEMGLPVKGRNEPCATGGVAWVMAKLYGVPYTKVIEAAWKNTVDVFGLRELN